MSTVLFLGAGFSAPFGHPTMTGFLQEVANAKNLQPSDKDFMETLRLEAKRANSILESSPTNLEDILSLAVMGDRLGLFGPDGEPRSPRVKDIIRRIYSKPGPQERYWDRYDTLKGFLGGDPQFWQGNLSIITTNYDLNAESALGRLHIGADLRTAFAPCTSDDVEIQGGRQLYAEGGIPLLKLHGSVNWFKKNDASKKLVVDGRVVSIVMGGRLPAACTGNYEPEGIPMIVPPSFLKPDLDMPLAHVWGAAAAALRAAETVVFVGYSFPPSDTEMKYFLASSLADNAKLMRILIVDPAGDRIEQRLRNPVSGFGSHFKDYLDVYSSDWKGLNLNLFKRS